MLGALGTVSGLPEARLSLPSPAALVAISCTSKQLVPETVITIDEPAEVRLHEPGQAFHVNVS